jgi:hypothetical protein
VKRWRGTDRFIDRRKWVRLERTFPVSLELTNLQTRKAAARPVEGRAVNISRLGLCVEAGRVTANGRNIFLDAMGEEYALEVVMSLPGKEEFVSAIAHAEWFDMVHTEERHAFRSGLRLVEMSDDHQAHWDRFVDECGGKTWWARLKDFIGGFSV